MKGEQSAKDERVTRVCVCRAFMAFVLYDAIVCDKFGVCARGGFE